MTDDELFAAITGLYAFDTGCVDSGIHDEALRARVKAALAKDVENEPARIVGKQLDRIARRFIEDPYGIEDMAGFIRWLGSHMGIEL